VVSCLGVMFAPHHQDAAAELLRVCRPGGTIALINWTPQGFIGRMFAAMRPYLPAPPAGVSPPPLWGEDEYLRGLLGDGVRDVAARRDTVRITRFPDGPAFRDYFRSNYGPTITAYRGLSDDPGRSAALDRDLADLAAAHDLGGGVMDWEYLLFTAHRA